MELNLLLFVTIVYILYISFIVYKYGVLPSISDSYYMMKDNIIGGSLFTFFIWSISLPLIVVSNTPLMFFAGAFLAFVGASPAFKDLKMTKRVHTIGAVGGILFGFLSLMIDFKLNELTYFAIVISLICYLLEIKNIIWWVENLALCVILYGLYISI